MFCVWSSTNIKETQGKSSDSCSGHCPSTVNLPPSPSATLVTCQILFCQYLRYLSSSMNTHRLRSCYLLLLPCILLWLMSSKCQYPFPLSLSLVIIIAAGWYGRGLPVINSDSSSMTQGNWNVCSNMPTMSAVICQQVLKSMIWWCVLFVIGRGVAMFMLGGRNNTPQGIPIIEKQLHISRRRMDQNHHISMCVYIVYIHLSGS